MNKILPFRTYYKGGRTMNKLTEQVVNLFKDQYVDLDFRVHSNNEKGDIITSSIVSLLTNENENSVNISFNIITKPDGAASYIMSLHKLLGDDVKLYIRESYFIDNKGVLKVGREAYNAKLQELVDALSDNLQYIENVKNKKYLDS